jgi:hypothetical protein
MHLTVRKGTDCIESQPGRHTSQIGSLRSVCVSATSVLAGSERELVAAHTRLPSSLWPDTVDELFQLFCVQICSSRITQ